MEKLLKKGKKGEYKFMLKPKYDRGELTREILRNLAAGVFIMGSIMAPNVAQLAALFEPADRRKIRKVLKSLKDKRLIKLVSRGDDDYIEITEFGHKKLLKYNIDDMVLNTNKRWDGIWRIVMFDIPRRYHKAGIALQAKLSELGFYRYQKSVYIIPHRCQDEVDFITHFFGVEHCVKYLELEKLEDELKLINIFELQH